MPIRLFIIPFHSADILRSVFGMLKNTDPVIHNTSINRVFIDLIKMYSLY
jgi:hypothetical protein